MTFQRIITFCFIAMLLMISAGVNDGQFDESNWGRLTEPLSHKHMCSWCAGQEDWNAAALNFSQQVLLLFHHKCIACVIFRGTCGVLRTRNPWQGGTLSSLQTWTRPPSSATPGTPAGGWVTARWWPSPAPAWPPANPSAGAGSAARRGGELGATRGHLMGSLATCSVRIWAAAARRCPC